MTAMEIKINREIRDYKENIFFGLSLRQLIFSLLACGVAVGIYLGLRDALGTETVSWLCILGAAPFAAMGFVKYHGMTAEKFFAVWLRSEFLVPKRLTFRPTNLYWEAMQEQRRQEAVINYDIDEYDERLLRHLALGYTKEMITNLKGMPFGVKSIEKRQNELINRLFTLDERSGVNACRLVTRAFELRILDIDNLEPDEE